MIGVEAEASVCERCGAALGDGERRILREQIEMERLDHAAAYEAAPRPTRGRTHWIAPRVRAPDVLVSTPRYNYVRRRYRLCAACDAAQAAAEAQALRFQQRAAKVVAGIAVAAAVVLVFLQFVWPSFYAAIGMKEDRTYLPYVKGYVPPNPTPYKPPFDAATPAEGGK